MRFILGFCGLELWRLERERKGNVISVQWCWFLLVVFLVRNEILVSFWWNSRRCYSNRIILWLTRALVLVLINIIILLFHLLWGLPLIRVSRLMLLHSSVNIGWDIFFFFENQIPNKHLKILNKYFLVHEFSWFHLLLDTLEALNLL